METPDTPRYRVPDDIAWIDGTEIGLGEQLYLTRLPSGDTVLLRDTARMIWILAAEGREVVGELARLVARPPAALEFEAKRFLGQLRDARLLTAHLPGASRAPSAEPPEG